MKFARLALLLLFASCAVPSVGQKAQPEPHAGYLFPAGGQQGATFRMYAGGQFLRGVNRVLVSGEGVSAKVIHHYRPLRNLDAAQRRELARQLLNAWNARLAELPEKERQQVSASAALQVAKGRKAAAETDGPVVLPDHPLINSIPDMNLWQIAHAARELQEYRKRQRNAQIGDLLEIEVVVDAAAEPGSRELRLGRPAALSNPLCFQVGTLAEAQEQEPNDPGRKLKLPVQPALELPATINGQIFPGDVDRIRFRGAKGQQLVVDVAARRLTPYLADAVPGWFQAVVAVYDSQGRELAYADDYRFNPDPALFLELPADGVYTLEIRDAIYRGREDFVYRVSLGELPFVTRVFPMGGQAGADVTADISGYNLPVTTLTLGTGAVAPGIHRTNLKTGRLVSNDVLFAADTVPEVMETEPGADGNTMVLAALPCTINGVIDVPGDTDTFTFEARAGEDITAEVTARRLGSPLDALLRLTDSRGNVLASNDDFKDKTFELMTHHADALLTITLPEDGVYQVQLLDAQQQGGPEWAYRMYLGPSRPDFALIATPSTINLRAAQTAPITVHAVRKGGFQGEISVTLAGVPPAFTLADGIIPAGQDSVQMTLTAPRRAMPQPLALEIIGKAVIGNDSVERRAIPAEDMMQAFLPRHLVPAHNMFVTVSRPGGPGAKANQAKPVKQKPKPKKAAPPDPTP